MTAHRANVFVVPLLLLLLLTSCARSDWHPDPSEAHTSTLKIEVFGSSSGNEQHYSSILTGALAAASSKEFKDVQPWVHIEPLEDAETVEDAVKTAKRIRDDPEVLAVIGHSYSSTTRAALPLYAEAGIPLLIPAATSPYVVYRFDEHEPWPKVQELISEHGSGARFNNAFRMIPSDVPSQVNALEATTHKLIGNGYPSTPKLMLICDSTKRTGADVYTRPICDSLRERKTSEASIATLVASYREIDLDGGDIWGLVTEINAVRPNYIILVAYPELARVLLEELRERAKALHESIGNLTFIMSEACLTNDLVGFGFPLYVTSPFNPSEINACIPPLTASMMRDRRVVPTNEGYAFDAVQIIAGAVKSCRAQTTLNRQCVRNYIEEHGRDLGGSCERYDIFGGERREAPYYVYSTCGKELRVKWIVMQNKKDTYASDQWSCH